MYVSRLAHGCDIGRVYVHDSLQAMAQEMSSGGKDVAGWSLSWVKQDMTQASQPQPPW